LSDADLLAQLKTAYSNLLMGKLARVIQKDGRRIEYSAADKDSLRSEINRLEAASGNARRRGPAGVM
jgi:hypothetical protein